MDVGLCDSDVNSDWCLLQVRTEHSRMVSVYTATGSTQGNTSTFTVLCVCIYVTFCLGHYINCTHIAFFVQSCVRVCVCCSSIPVSRILVHRQQ